MERDAEPKSDKLIARWLDLKRQQDEYAAQLVKARQSGDSRKVADLHKLWKKYYTQTHKVYMLLKRLGIIR